MEPTRQDATTRLAHFGLWDTICIIVGIIVGAGIYRTPGTIFALAGGPIPAFAVWVAGGLLAIIGALCFAELASTYPRSGGEYVYLTRAFGSWAGFLFAWGQLLIIRTGASMVVMAYVFAEHAVRLAGYQRDAPDYPSSTFTAIALLTVVLLTIINIVGVHTGKWTQNILTTAKVLGLGVVFIVALVWARGKSADEGYVVYQGRITAVGSDAVMLSTADTPGGRPFPFAAGAELTIDGASKSPTGEAIQTDDLRDLRAKVLVRADAPTQAIQVKASRHSLFGSLSLALIFVLWTYAGWHEAAYIAAEVRDPQRKVPRALWLGTSAVIVLYLLINLAYVVGLGYEDAASSQLVAADVLALMPWKIGEQAICILIMISSLGAVNGIIFTSSRIFSEFGNDHKLFAPLGHWHGNLGTPVLALLAQGAISVLTILIVAYFFTSQDSFDAVVKGTAPVFWLFFLLTGLALFWLRRKDRGIDRPFSVPLYPLTPLLYCAFCGLMLYGSMEAAFEERLSGLFVLLTVIAVLAGLPLYWLSRKMGRPQPMTGRGEVQKVHTAVGE